MPLSLRNCRLLHPTVDICWSTMTRLPEMFCDFAWIDTLDFPPSEFIAVVMKLPMMDVAEWHGPLIADLLPHGARLRMTDVMGMTWLSAADQAGLGADELEVFWVAHPFGAFLQERPADSPGSGRRQLLATRTVEGLKEIAIMLAIVRLQRRKRFS